MDDRTLINSLLNPNVYPHPVTETSIKLIETHLSWVLLTGSFAYKIKKPVNFGFVDYSSLEKRCFYCQEEVRLNYPLSENNIYLEVIKISGSLANPVFNGQDKVIEYAVKMKQFDQNNLLTHQLIQNELSPDHFLSIAEQLASFHQSSEKTRKDIPYGTPEKIWEELSDIFLYFSSYISDYHVLNQIQQLKEWGKQEFNKHKTVFEYRKSRGYIRDCHGDVHLNNMVLLDGRVTLFDRIEFNAEFRCIDVMNEIAFLIMDLEAREREDLSSVFLNHYLELTGDYGGVKLLPFYKLYRALVRAKVALLSGFSIQDVEFTSYLNLAKTYILPKNPLLIILHGVSGSGKSFGSAKLISSMHLIRIRSDCERKRMFGAKGDPKKIYAKENIHKVYKKLKTIAEDLLKAGNKIVVDATFLNKKHRDLFKDLANVLGVPFKIIHFEESLSVLKERILQRKETESEDVSAANRIDILEKQIALQDPLTEEELSVSDTGYFQTK